MKLLKEIYRKESGQAFIMVLILLLVGMLILAPLLALMSTGLIAARSIDEKTDEVYAADAGIEDALHKIVNNDASLPATVGGTWTLDPIVVNDKDVTVEIVLEEDAEGFIGEGLLGENYSGIHEDWQVATYDVGDGTYALTINYSGSAAKEFVSGVGAWLQGDYEYVGSAVDMTDDYPNFIFEQRGYKGGTAFIWKWQSAANMPEFGSVSGITERTLSFIFTPEVEPAFTIGWAVANQAAIGVVTSGETFVVWKISATATDSITGMQTEIIAYVSRQGVSTYEMNVITWEIDPAG